MNDLWARILTWFAAHVPPGFFSPNPGASESEIRDAEAALGLRLPADFVESYRLHNGGREGAFFRNYELMPLKEITRTAAFKKQLLTLDWGDYIPQPEGPIKQVFWNAQWVPFMDTGSGDNLCIDLDPAPGGAVGQVIEFGHELGPERLIAPSFCAWLSQFADDLEAGRYGFGEESLNIERIETEFPPADEAFDGE
jgi:cell wall assembly regulator SMI1